MISYLDPIIFPDECKIYQFNDRFIYPIFKNGSTTITSSCSLLDPVYLNSVNLVEVFVREPYDRYISGVQTYLNNNLELDRPTSLKLISEFLFLNRHFSLQFHWLMNFARFSKAKFYIRPIKEISTITDKKINEKTRDNTLDDYFKDNSKLHFYLQIDKVIYEQCTGNIVEWSDILALVKKNNLDIYNEVIQRSKNLCNVLE